VHEIETSWRICGDVGFLWSRQWGVASLYGREVEWYGRKRGEDGFGFVFSLSS
jgi:hypothetical protein